MTYHLGPVDPDRRAELFADAREGEPQPRPRHLLSTMLAVLVMLPYCGWSLTAPAAIAVVFSWPSARVSRCRHRSFRSPIFSDPGETGCKPSSA